MTTDERLAKLFQGAPSSQTWLAWCHLLGESAAKDRASLIREAETHLADWPETLLRCIGTVARPRAQAPGKAWWEFWKAYVGGHVRNGRGGRRGRPIRGVFE